MQGGQGRRNEGRCDAARMTARSSAAQCAEYAGCENPGHDKIDADVTAAVVVGDSVWDLLAAHRARALGVGLLSGGYGQDELERAGAYRVYHDPADLLRHVDEVGVRPAD